MNNKQVAHLWANKARPAARGSSFYFDGDTIYSYGSHFPIARHIERAGKPAVLFTTRTYSVTTAKHRGYAHGALYGLNLPVFHVVHPRNDPRSEDYREQYVARLQFALDALVTARTRKDMHAQDAGRIAREANDCAEFFGWKWRLEVPRYSDQWLEEQRAKRRAINKAERIKREERERAEGILRAGRVSAWRNGGTMQQGDSPETLLRVKGDVIETSRGAEIPLSHAPRLWRVICAARAGHPYQHNGHTEHAGEFRVDSVDTDGTLRAGCHTIKYPELEFLARVLGLEVANVSA